MHYDIALQSGLTQHAAVTQLWLSSLVCWWKSGLVTSHYIGTKMGMNQIQNQIPGSVSKV